MFSKFLVILSAVATLLATSLQSATAQMTLTPIAFNLSGISKNTLWVGTFDHPRMCFGCRGATRLKFNIVNGQIASVEAWAKNTDEAFKDASNPNLDMPSYGILTANQITFNAKDEMVLLFPQQIQYNVKYMADGTLRGTMDPRIHPKRFNWVVVDFVMRPVQSN